MAVVVVVAVAVAVSRMEDRRGTGPEGVEAEGAICTGLPRERLGMAHPEGSTAFVEGMEDGHDGGGIY